MRQKWASNGAQSKAWGEGRPSGGAPGFACEASEQAVVTHWAFGFSLAEQAVATRWARDRD